MSGAFDYFIVLAEMRTGSNFLEANLNALNGIACHGEAFNPHFIGYPNKTDLLGITRAMRDADPAALIAAVRDAPDDLAGFRFFHDHDPRALEAALADPRCAKIVLTRNPLDSYLSWKIAQETGQWKLTNIKRRKDARARFDAEEFATHVARLQTFQVEILNSLQRSGQTAFHLAFEDLQDVEVMNGLARWLGVDSRLDRLDQSLKRQNPSPPSAKVANPDEMEAALAGVDWFNLSRTPNFEPRRGPSVPSYVLGAGTPLLFLPIRGGPDARVTRWMAQLDGVDEDALQTGLNQKALRKWMRGTPDHRRFTVLRHPLARAHAVFCDRILSVGPGSYLRIRETLRKQFKLPIPKAAPDDGYSRADHRAAFEAFLGFLRMNLAGQTPIRVDGHWCSQAQALSNFAEFTMPDLVCREDEMADLLPDLARRCGHPDPPAPDPAEPDRPHPLGEIYDADLEKLAAEIYHRDYLMFGFGPWRAD